MLSVRTFDDVLAYVCSDEVFWEPHVALGVIVCQQWQENANPARQDMAFQGSLFNLPFTLPIQKAQLDLE